MSWTKGRPQLDRTAKARTLRRHPVCMCKGCIHCGQRCTAPSTDDDHIIPWFEGGSDADSNHQGLCSSCHSVKTKVEAARARAALPRAKRPAERHPGLA